jgi:hypothetical protein
MPFLWKLSPLADCNGITCPAKFPCSAASLLCPFRVARISRLIGKSDITSNSRGWQVELRGSRLPAPLYAGFGGRKTCQTQETPLLIEWRFPISYLWPLASQTIYGRWCLHRTNFRLARPVSLLRAASMAVALAGRLLFLGLAGISPQPVHHWRLSNSNPRAIQSSS